MTGDSNFEGTLKISQMFTWGHRELRFDRLWKVKEGRAGEKGASGLWFLIFVCAC